MTSEIPPKAIIAYIKSINAEPIAIAIPSLNSFLIPFEIKANAIGPRGGMETTNPVIVPTIKVKSICKALFQ
jgi:hypothetical protein